MPCSSTNYSSTRNNNFKWENFVRSISYHVPSHFEPNNLADLVWILKNAEAEGNFVKAVGSGWSIENIAVSENWIVDMRQLSNEITSLIDIDNNFISNAVANTKRNIHNNPDEDSFIQVQSGIKIIDLNELLESKNLSMITLGGAQGQTISGAISTSTHGSDIEHTPLPDLVEAIHLVTNGGREYWVESSSNPFTDNDNELISLLDCSETTIIRDDSLFNSLLVGIGRFGIIYSYVLRVTNEFRIVEWANQLSWSSIEDRLREGVESGNLLDPLNSILPSPMDGLNLASTQHRYLDLAFNPRNSENCWLRRRWLTEDIVDQNLDESDVFLCHHGVGNLIVAAASAILSAYAGVVGALPFYGWVKGPMIAAKAIELATMSGDPHLTGGKALTAAVNAILESQIGEELLHHVTHFNQIALDDSAGKSSSNPKKGIYWKVNSGSTESAFDQDCYNGTSIEMIFDTITTNFIDFINTVLDNSHRYQQLGYVSVRFSRRSEALLSMHNVSSIIAVSIEVTSLHGMKDDIKWLEFLEERALSLGGRPHWGQKNNIGVREVTRLYGENLAEWRRQLEKIVQGSPMFSNEYTKQRGLEPGISIREVSSVRKENGVITHLCNEGAYWSPVDVETAISQIQTRSAFYETLTSSGESASIYVREYLTTFSDNDTTNNLRNLLNAKMIGYGMPASSTIEREVNVIQLNEASDNPWETWISFIGNSKERWKVHILEAQLQVRNSTHQYFILNEDGTKNYLQYRKHLVTAPNDNIEDNLDNLPIC